MSEELTTGSASQSVGAEDTQEELQAPAPEREAAPAAPVDAAVEAAEANQAEEPSPAEVPADSGGIVEPADEPVAAEDMVVTLEAVDSERARFKAIIEAVIYITDEPLSAQQIAGALGQPIEAIRSILDELNADYNQSDRGLSIREVAGGYKMATKPEHHEEIRAFVKNLKPPLKLSLAALETLAVIAYKQPITAPEIMEIRGVQGAGVLKTLLDRKLIATAGRKNVIGKPILYKTTRDFLVQFGLKDLAELPTLKEFEELGRLALTDADAEPGQPAPPAPPVDQSEPTLFSPEQEDESREVPEAEAAGQPQTGARMDTPAADAAPSEEPVVETATTEAAAGEPPSPSDNTPAPEKAGTTESNG